jgi:hypothetical protein
LIGILPAQAGASVEVAADPAASGATVSLEAGGAVGPVSTAAGAEVGLGFSPPALPPVPSPELPPLLPLVPTTVPPTVTTRPVPREPVMAPAPIATPAPAERPAPEREPRRARASGPRRDAGTGRPAARRLLEPPSLPNIGTTPPLGAAALPTTASTTDDGGTGSSTRERILRAVSAAARPALGVLIGLLLAFGAYLAVQRRLDGGDRLACAGGGRPPDDEKISF